MAETVSVTRRSVIAAVPALCLANQLAAWPGPATSVLAVPVLQIVQVRTALQAADLVGKLRQTPGCMKVDVLQQTDGGVSVFQQWVSNEASARFWRTSEPKPAANVYTRIEV